MLSENKINHFLSVGITIYVLMCLFPHFSPYLSGHGKEVVLIGFIISFCTYFKVSRALFEMNRIYKISNFIDVENINKQNVSGVKVSASNTKLWELDFDIIEKYKSEKRKVWNVLLLSGLIFLIIYMGWRIGMTSVPIVCFIAFCSFRIFTWGQVLAFLYINLFSFSLGFSIDQSSHVLFSMLVLGCFFILQKLLVTFHWWKISKVQSKFEMNIKGSLSIILASCLMSLILSSVLNPKLNLVKDFFYYCEKILPQKQIKKVKDNDVLSKDISVEIPKVESLNSVKYQNYKEKNMDEVLKDLKHDLESVVGDRNYGNLNKKVEDLEKVRVRLKLKGEVRSKKTGEISVSGREQLRKDLFLKAKKLSKEISFHRDNKELDQISFELEQTSKDKVISKKKLNELENKVENIEKKLLERSDKKLIKKSEKLKNKIDELQIKKRDNEERQIWERLLILLGFFSMFLFFKEILLKNRIVDSSSGLSDSTKKDLRFKLKNIHKRYPSFKAEVLAKYRFFHLAVEEIYYNGDEAPPSVVIGRQLSEKGLRELAFELSNFFDKTQFVEESQFSKKDIKQFRKSFGLFERYLKKILK